jgi:hypothetical protein
MAVGSSNYTFGDEGKDTMKEAENTYTAINNNYFDIGQLDAFTKR